MESNNKMSEENLTDKALSDINTLNKRTSMDNPTKKIIDLHIHSRASDGSFTPAEIIKMATEIGLSAIAITDHDTIAGSKQALKDGIPSSLEFVTGVEISADVPSYCSASSSLHMLGYFIQLDDPFLNKTLDGLQTARLERTPLMLDKLNSLGVEISLDEVIEMVGDSQPGRPHIAKVLLKKGAVKSFQEAFDFYLGKDKPAYVEKNRLSAQEAIEIILKAGGMPVMAHPFLLKIEDIRVLENLIVNLKAAGLQGLEAIYPEHTPEHVQIYKDIAKKHDLLITGGTDFHGSFKPGIQLGFGYGNLSIPYSVYEKMLIKKNYSLSEKKNEQDIQMTESNNAIPDNINFAEIEAKLLYSFQDKNILREALQHSSYVNEHPELLMNDNERLEFLGDAVLNLVVGHLLMDQFQEVNEGDLSRMRATMVNEKQLAEIARNIDIQPYLLLGKGEIHTNGREKQSILADTLEAIIAAVYLDGGFKTSYDFIEKHFSYLFIKVKNQDYKSELQEFAQGTLKQIPIYEVIHETGPDHQKTFQVKLVVGDTVKTTGSGKSKKRAEQDAARAALDIFKIMGKY